MLNKVKKVLPYAILFLPVVALAQTSISGLILTLTTIINTIIPFIFGLAFLIFIWGLIKYVTAGGDETKKKEGQGTMVWGIIVLFIMLSVWGLVNILSGSFTFNNQLDFSKIPQVPF